MDGLGFEPMSCIHGFMLFRIYKRSYLDMLSCFNLDLFSNSSKSGEVSEYSDTTQNSYQLLRENDKGAEYTLAHLSDKY
jgi:hypothetical protein